MPQKRFSIMTKWPYPAHPVGRNPGNLLADRGAGSYTPKPAVGPYSLVDAVFLPELI